MSENAFIIQCRRITMNLTEAGTALREDALSVPEEMKSCIGLSMEECVILRNLLDKALVHMGQ